MLRKALPFVLTLLAVTSLHADSRQRAVGSPKSLSGNTVSGVVTAVNGSNVTLANGLVTVDVSHATITNDRGASATITPGSQIFAILDSSNSLTATTVIVMNNAQVTISGPVQGVNAGAGTLQVLGLTIHVDANTSFGGERVRGLNDVMTGDQVIAQVNAVGSTLVATSILVFPQMATTHPTLLHGPVKSIGTDSWVITDSHRGDTPVVVNAQTKIIGSPKVGDTVDVLANVDKANNFVAISIALSPVQPTKHVTGTLKSKNNSSILGSVWTITPSTGADVQVRVTGETKIVGNPQIGDRVDALVQPLKDDLFAISITKQ